MKDDSATGRLGRTGQLDELAAHPGILQRFVRNVNPTAGFDKGLETGFQRAVVIIDKPASRSFAGTADAGQKGWVPRPFSIGNVNVYSVATDSGEEDRGRRSIFRISGQFPMMKISDHGLPPGASFRKKAELKAMGPCFVRSVEVRAGFGQPFEFEGAESPGVNQAQPAAASPGDARCVQKSREVALVIPGRDFQALFNP